MKRFPRAVEAFYHSSMLVFTREAVGAKPGECVHEQLSVQQAALKNAFVQTVFLCYIWCRMSAVTLEICRWFRAILSRISHLGYLGEMI